MLCLCKFSLIFWFLSWKICGFLLILDDYIWNNPNILVYQKVWRELKYLNPRNILVYQKVWCELKYLNPRNILVYQKVWSELKYLNPRNILVYQKVWSELKYLNPSQICSRFKELNSCEIEMTYAIGNHSACLLQDDMDVRVLHMSISNENKNLVDIDIVRGGGTLVVKGVQDDIDSSDNEDSNSTDENECLGLESVAVVIRLWRLMENLAYR
ncbi:uncharacterized protein Pyn_03343 [Prunus yedoensis var. nudiflora]|uniref:Uncharacterized protein n=1 Tax=Prunus yedoensis var. nudiflora TaxID=2094558 RepID=A0A314ZPH3_PRUYE|nr:uncharacterized protein Pyn_03343 [Prunus yedoensis var. nudiflora]